MEIFIASRLSNGNFFFPTEIRIDDSDVTILQPGVISAREKTLQISKITSVDVVSPIFGFSKIIISAYGLDKIVSEGFERRDAEMIKYLIFKNKKGS